MAFQSNHQLTGAGDDEAAARNYLSRKKPKTPPPAPRPSSSYFQSHHSTTAADAVCNLSPSQTARITQPYTHSLIAWICGKDIGCEHLERLLGRHLRLTQKVKASKLDLGYFVLQFSQNDYSALEELPWPIPNLCINAFPWTPDFKPSEAINSSVNVWIRLHELSIEYYDDEILQEIAKTIGGELVKIDPVTKERKKCKFARICIRINLSDTLRSTIKLGGIRQEIEYEGFDLLCHNCRRVVDLYHDCMGLSNPNLNPSGSSGFDLHRDKPHHHRTRPHREFASSSKLPIPSESSPASSWGSRFQALEKDLMLEGIDFGNKGGAHHHRTRPCREIGSSSTSNQPLIPSDKDPMLDLKLNDWPRLPFGGCEKAGTSRRIDSPDVHVKDKAVAKEKGKCVASVSVPPLPNFPKESTTVTIKAPELKLVAPFVVQNQFMAAKTKNLTMIADDNNQRPQPSSPTARIPSLQPCPASEASLNFHSAAIQRLTRTKEITNTPSKEMNVDCCPTVYTVDPKKITSFAVALSEVRTRTTMVSNQNQYAIDIVPTLRSGDEGGVCSEAVSGSESESCSKKMLCWKFHGTDNAKLMRSLKDLIQLHEPSIVLIFGTKISGADADQVVRELSFSGSYCRKPDGYNGGTWLLLSKKDVQTKVNSYSPQQVSASVHFHSKTNVPEFSPLDEDTKTSSGPWGSTFFYTSTKWMNSVAY